MLTNQDSNLDRQNQKLQCYHYTIGHAQKGNAKVKKKSFLCKGKRKKIKMILYYCITDF